MSPRIRILHVLHSLAFGGAERLVGDIVANSSSARFEHGLLYLSPPTTLAPALSSRLAFLEELGWRGRRHGLLAAWRIAGVARRWRPDVVQSVLIDPNISARLAVLFGARARFVTNVVSMDYAPQTVRAAGWDPRKVAVLRAIDLATATLARTTFVACSACVAASTVADLGAAPGAVRVIYNGVDPATLAHDAGEPARLRAEHGIPPEALLLVNLSRMVAAKGQDLLLRAFRLVVNHRPELWLALVGGGPEEKALRALTAQLELEHRVRFVGQPAQVGPSLAMADAFVFPSLVEGLPLSVIEAMLAGVPAVVSDIQPNREAVEHGVTGLLFESGRAESLAGQLEVIASDPALRARLSAAARTRAERTFTSARIIQQWEALYEELGSAGAR